ncbi:hypothetical protein VRB23_10950 [Erwinia aphidicola]|uniref:hypothetical protein n=1 Tax=Erwinia aphidicola TaxID=68334 RepID=UPI0030D1E374
MKSKYEESLVVNGFTEKEINTLFLLAKNYEMSLPETLKRLKRVFLCVFIFRVIMTLLLIYSFIYAKDGGCFGILIGYVFAMIIFEVLTPSITGTKILLRYKRLIG